jgi:hypothetical protein
MSISETDRLKAQLDYLTAQAAHMQRGRDLGEVDRMKNVQIRCDAALSLYGARATEPTPLESEVEYRRRLLGVVADRTEKYRGSRFAGFDNNSLDALEPLVLAEAQDAARHDANAKPGVLIPMQHRDPSGRTITTYAGDVGAFLAPFMAQGVTGSINRFPKGGQ